MHNPTPVPTRLADAQTLARRLAHLHTTYPAAQPDMVADIVRAILLTMHGDLSVNETALLAEVEDLAKTVANARAEIAALRADDITASHIPSATDELDAIVAHTACATDTILEACESLDALAPSLDEATIRALQDVTTRIYEACSFQDITGQRINKVIKLLASIEERIGKLDELFGTSDAMQAGAGENGSNVVSMNLPIDDKDLLNGPQLSGKASTQEEIDMLFASLSAKK